MHGHVDRLSHIAYPQQRGLLLHRQQPFQPHALYRHSHPQCRFWHPHTVHQKDLYNLLLLYPFPYPALIGSYLCLRALSWSLGAFPNEFTLSKKYHLGLEGKVPWQFYLYVVALLILTASASALQVWLFRQKMKNSN